VAGPFGAWTPNGAEVTANGGYEIAWKVPGADQYGIWMTDTGGNQTSNTDVMSGASITLESYEPSFHQDLNGDGMIGIPTRAIQTNGSTSLVKVRNNFYLYANGTSSGPELKYGGVPVMAGQFGAWTPIGAIQTATGYEVAWKVPGVHQYGIWMTDSNGNFTSNTAVMSGTSTTLETYETSFHPDLIGHGVIGVSRNDVAGGCGFAPGLDSNWPS
jgi:serralysin